MAGRNSEESTYRVAQDEILIATGGWEAGRERKIVIFFSDLPVYVQFRRTAERRNGKHRRALDGCRMSHFVSEGADVSPSP